jgi:hypothetical protein
VSVQYDVELRFYVAVPEEDARERCAASGNANPTEDDLEAEAVFIVQDLVAEDQSLCNLESNVERVEYLETEGGSDGTEVRPS